MKRLEVLSSEEIEKIHEQSLVLLEEPGVKILDENALRMLSEKGVDVDFKNQTARFSESQVEESLKACPERFDALSREKENHVEIGGDNVYVASGFYSSYVLKNGKRVPGTVEDVANFAKISDCLGNIDGVGVAVLPQDVPVHASELYACNAMLNNTGKHLFFSPNTRASAKGLVEILRVVVDGGNLRGSQIATFQSSSTAPLAWESESIGVLMEAAKAGISCNVLPEPLAGATSPVTLAGLLLVHNVEFLSGLIISQLVRKGTPIIYGYSPTIFDMREASAIIASPETVAARVAHAQIGRFYSLPVHCICPDSDGQCHDEQMAWEKIATLFASLGSGVNIVMNSGMFSTGLISSYEQLVIDNEIVGFTKRVVEGIKVDQDTLAVDLIQKVGPRGHFLNQMHTLKHLRKEYWMPELSNRAAYDKWLRSGGRTVAAKAKEKVAEILANHKVSELDPGREEKIKAIIQRYEKGE